MYAPGTQQAVGLMYRHTPLEERCYFFLVQMRTLLLGGGKSEGWQRAELLCVNPLLFGLVLVFFRKAFHCVGQASPELKMILLPQLSPVLGLQSYTTMTPLGCGLKTFQSVLFFS